MNERQRQFLDVLAQTMIMPAEHIAAYQHRLMEPLLRHARETTPFYRDRLQAVMRPDGTIEFDRWAEIPPFTRTMAQAAGSGLFAATLPTGTERGVEGQTSGSTGIPLRHRRSSLADLASRCHTQRDYDWYGMDMNATMADIHEAWNGRADYPEGRGGGKWNIRGDGELIVLDVRTNVEQQIDWLRRRKPRYLMTYPSLLRALAEHVIEAGNIAISFDLVFTVGEILSPDVRARAQRAFGARVLDRYGATEAGHLATECPDCGQYHVSAESALVEVLREDGSSASPGETGRVVVTPFYNFAMPLIRYEIGDFAEVGMSGACLRTLPSLRRVLGRERNMFLLPDGGRVWPDTRTIEMQKFLGFQQIQVVQIAPAEIEVRYVSDGSGRQPDQTGLQDYFRSVLHPELQVHAIAVDAIARLPSGKFEDYVSLVHSPAVAA
jgi:phenylacetate-CoA ligase